MRSFSWGGAEFLPAEVHVIVQALETACVLYRRDRNGAQMYGQPLQAEQHQRRLNAANDLLGELRQCGLAR